MLNRTGFLLFLIFCAPSFMRGQSYQLTGSVKAEGLEALSIALNFEVDAQGNLKGTSTIDVDGPNETQSAIEGRVDWPAKKLSFRETKNLSSLAQEDQVEFCYVSAQALQILSVDEQEMVFGPFQGFLEDSSSCTQGSLHLVGKLQPAAPKASPTKKATIVHSDAKTEKKETKLAEETNLHPTEEKKEQTLNGGGVLMLDWEREEISLDIWDSFEEDGDQVEVYLNDSLLYPALDIRLQKQTLNFGAQSEPFTIRIRSTNEGSQPPTTVHAVLKSAQNEQRLVIKLKKGESAALSFFKP